MLEPFNPTYRYAWLGSVVQLPYQYVADHNADTFRRPVADLLALRPPVTELLRRARSPRQAAGAARTIGQALAWRRQHRRVVLKDPLSLFAAPWMVEEFGVIPVVLVRHPAAFTGSLKRLDWQFDFTSLTRQPELLADVLAPFADEISRAAAEQPDVIDQAILLWRLLNHTVAGYADRGWIVLRYEDLAASPAAGFERLYHRLGLTWSPAVEARLATFTSESNATDAPLDRALFVRRSSTGAMWTWVRRLDADEVRRVRTGTADVAERFYSDADWCPPEDAPTR